MRKKVIACLCLLFLKSFKLTGIGAESLISQPYLYVQAMQVDWIDKETCLEVLRTADLMVDASQKEAIQHEIQSYQQKIDGLNEEYHQLVNGETDSLKYAEEQLEQVTETIFYEALQFVEGFVDWSEEEQLTYISDNEAFIAWQDYLTSMHHLINENVAEQTYLLESIQQLEYDLSQVEQINYDSTSLKNLQQQVLYYPYAVPSRTIEEVRVNLNHLDLNQAILAVDEQLTRLIPSTYSKLKFDTIYNYFKYEQQPHESLQNDVKVVFDSDALYHYSYAKEFGERDLLLYTVIAQNNYQFSKDISQYQQAYGEMIQLKNEQFNFFYQINQEAFDYLALEFTKYLNDHYIHTDDDVEQIRQFQSKHQVRLATLQDDVWVENISGESGYLTEYSQKAFQTIESISLGLEETFEEDQIISEELSSETSLDQLKQSLVDQSKKNELPQPPSLPTSKASKDEPAPTSATSTKAPKLPSTGEIKRWSWIAGGLFLFGIGLLSINLVVRYKRRQKFKDIDLN